MSAFPLTPRCSPCPFCGSTNVDPEGWMSVNQDGTQKKTGPACDECGGSTENVERWNTRISGVAQEAGRVAELEAALRALVDQVNDYERVNNLAPNPGRTECWDTVANAKRILSRIWMDSL